MARRSFSGGFFLLKLFGMLIHLAIAALLSRNALFLFSGLVWRLPRLARQCVNLRAGSTMRVLPPPPNQHALLRLSGVPVWTLLDFQGRAGVQEAALVLCGSHRFRSSSLPPGCSHDNGLPWREFHEPWAYETVAGRAKYLPLLVPVGRQKCLAHHRSSSALRPRPHESEQPAARALHAPPSAGQSPKSPCSYLFPVALG